MVDIGKGMSFTLYSAKNYTKNLERIDSTKILHRTPPLYMCSTLQRQNTEISKQIFKEKEYQGLSPNFHFHASVSYLYIPKMGLPFLLEEICRPILGLYKSLTDT